MKNIILAIVVLTILISIMFLLEIWGLSIPFFSEMFLSYICLVFVFVILGMYIHYVNEQKRNISETGKSLVD